MFRFFLRSDDYVYNTFLEEFMKGVQGKDMGEAIRIAIYIAKKRPRVSERLFKFFKPKLNVKRSSVKSKKSVVQH